MRLVTLLLLGCGAAQSGGVSGGDPDHPLHGAWATSTAPDGDPLPCPLVIELFDDGTVEVNYMSDDSREKMCQFVRIPWQHDDSVTPHRIRMAGQLSSCIYQREGALLRLSCEDHGRYPTDFEASMLLERIPVTVGSALVDIVGEWTAFGFWGGSARMNVSPNGDYTLGESSGRIEVRNDHQLDMSLGPNMQSCLYRVTEHRLTLRCNDASQGFPTSFVGDEGAPSFVLSRGAPDVPVRAVSAQSRGRGDSDGDGVRNADDACPESAEDYDAFEDEDGCPDVDNDQDGVTDDADQCPNAPETRNGIEDFDGCPE